MPGGTERVINTKSTTVVEDVISELCNVIGIETENEKEEFSLYCIVEGETFNVPLTKDHYILDVTTGKKICHSKSRNTHKCYELCRVLLTYLGTIFQAYKNISYLYYFLELQRDGAIYYLIFCRSIWHYPLRVDNTLYTEVVFNQIAPDYLEGLLLIMPGEQIDQQFVYDIAKVCVKPTNNVNIVLAKSYE